MLKVFLVEDESVVREALRDNIPWQQYGYRFVGEAGDGEMALPLIRKTVPDVLITDIKMPFMDGLALSHIVKSEYPDMKIIIISGYDDFDYARQAISEGVDEYLLKPITRRSLQKSLSDIREKIEAEQEQKNYVKKFQSEMQQYEQYALHSFFEKVFEGRLSAQELYEEAGKQGLDINASGYDLMLFGVQEDESREDLLRYFLRFPECMVFRWNMNTYGVLLMGDAKSLKERANTHLDYIKKTCEASGDQDWYVAAGTPVERFSQLSDCYRRVNHIYAYRYLTPEKHVLTEELAENASAVCEGGSFGGLDVNKVDPEIIRGFLNNGQRTEVDDFVGSYMQGLGEAVASRLFRDYLLLNIQFTAQAFMESIGCEQEEYLETVGADRIHEMVTGPDTMAEYVRTLLTEALRLRDEKQKTQGKKVLQNALDYIEANYMQTTLNLNEVARAIGMSPNYFSGLFSQEMKMTFVEYVTNKRMEQAKRLLKESDQSSAQIAAAVGYKDAHYFSFVFKKTVGVSPRDYRAKSQENTNRATRGIV
ncbi:MAG: response regulator [bacterium]|nr:response regulator [bacterium]MDY4099167.1 response regulator [Lachnospiraceae bacterium]